MLEEIHTMLEIYQELIDKTSLLKDKTMPKVELDIIYLTLLDNNKLPQFYNNLKLDIIHIELELLDKIIHTTSLLYIHNARDITPVYRVVHHIRDTDIIHHNTLLDIIHTSLIDHQLNCMLLSDILNILSEIKILPQLLPQLLPHQ